IMRNDAEQLKCQYGVAVSGLVDQDMEISIPGIPGRPEKIVRQSTLSQIIQPRIEEILEIVDQELKRSGYAGQLGAGVVLTGGGSLIPGTIELASDVLGLEARQGTVTGLSGGLVQEVTNPKFATGVGLVLFGLRPETLANLPFSLAIEGNRSVHHQDGSVREKIKERMTAWFNEL
ncbi:cell division FtsA domain-containing protein, partial [Bacteroidota bacterium]